MMSIFYCKFQHLIAREFRISNTTAPTKCPSISEANPEKNKRFDAKNKRTVAEAMKIQCVEMEKWSLTA